MSSTPGQRLRTGRERQNKSREDIKNEVHKALATIKSWELDQTRPRFEDLEAVCKAYGISVQEYVVGELDITELSHSEARLLAAFNLHSEENRKAILQFIETIST